MSAATPVPASTMDKKPYEPSMEEILASIRRIIADDQSLPGHGAVSSALRAPAPPIDEPMPAPIPQHRDPPVDASFRGTDDLGADERLAPPADEADAPESFDDGHEAARQHGAIAAPQFPSPAGRVQDAHAAGVHPVGSATPVSRPIPRGSTPSADPHFAEPRFEEPHFAGTETSALPPQRHGTPADPHPAQPEARLAPPQAVHAESDAWDDDADAEEDAHSYDESLAALPEGAPGLFSAATDTSIASAFNMLAASRLADNSDELMNMVREMIRPLLRSWLDDNLPSMVERMVRAEIERVARGGR